MADQPRDPLPVAQHRRTIVDTVLRGENRVTIISSATGSGKSTQIPQYLVDDGGPGVRRVTVTQPRRIAAISIAQRVARERGDRVGGAVGYTVRFDEKTGRGTRIRYVTDGIAVREALLDRRFSGDSVFVVDEAHERSAQTDVLLGLLRQALHAGGRLRVVIMSATIDTQAFAGYFGTPQVLFVQGRSFPVRHRFLPGAEANYLEAVSVTVAQIARAGRGDVLVFLPGEREISMVAGALRLMDQHMGLLEVLPLFASMNQDEQLRIFAPKEDPARTRCIIATNIAETSLTVPNITYVVDSGFARVKVYDSRQSAHRLLTVPASKSSVMQRSGRVGRTGPGVVYHIYTYEAYRDLPQNTVPEIQRCDLKQIYMTLIGCGVARILDFQFVSPPSVMNKRACLADLLRFNLVAAEEGQGGGASFRLTELGRQVVMLPLEVEESLSVIRAVRKNSRPLIRAVTQMISILNSIEQFFTSSDEQTTTNRSVFRNALSDHLMLLEIFRQYQQSDNKRQFCSKYGVQARTMEYINKVHKQISEVVEKQLLAKSEGAAGECDVGASCTEDDILQCLCYGFRNNIVRAGRDGKSYERQNVVCRIHPSSGVRHSDILIYHELIQTSDLYMRVVSAVKPEWIAEFE